MGKGIFTYYKERLIEIGGNNKCLYLKNIVRRSAYDLGKIFEGRDDKVNDFVEFLRSNKKYPLSIISNTEKNAILQNLPYQKILSDIAHQVSVDYEMLKRKARNPLYSKGFLVCNISI